MQCRQLLSLLALLCTLSRTGLAQTSSPDGAPPSTCPSRYLLYSVQSGEGFSLRRDAFVRMGVALMLAKQHSNEGGRGSGGDGSGRWTLILPPLSSRLSPHWHQGVPHAGVGYTEQNVPWNQLWDMDFLGKQTGLRFVEFDEYAARQNAAAVTHAHATAAATGTTAAAPAPAPLAAVDQVLHLCSFSYSSPYFESGRLAGLQAGASNFPGSSFPRSHVFHEFACGARPDPQVGFCSNAMPVVVDAAAGERRQRASSATKQQAIVVAEYGAIRLPRGARDSIHCGHANLMPPVLPHLLDEFVGPSASASASSSSPSSPPPCSVLVTNSQLIFWPAPPYPGQSNTADPAVATHVAKNLFLRSLRLSPMLLAIAHTFVRHALRASTALPLSSAEALAALHPDDVASALDSAADSATDAALPPYLSFHVRRGDFKRVHAGVVPDLEHLALQIVRRFRFVWSARQNATTAATTATGAATPSAASSPSAPATTPLLSRRVFLSSDMDASEFEQLQVWMRRVQSEVPAGRHAASGSGGPPAVVLVRFDLERVRTTLRPRLSDAVNAYLDGASAAAALHVNAARASASSAATGAPLPSSSSSRVVPLTPFAVLLLDQLLAELSLPRLGFVGTRHSYVSEMVWQQRRAWNIEDNNRWEKDVLEGGAKNDKQTTTTTTATDAASHSAKDEL